MPRCHLPIKQYAKYLFQREATSSVHGFHALKLVVCHLDIYAHRPITLSHLCEFIRNHSHTLKDLSLDFPHSCGVQQDIQSVPFVSTSLRRLRLGPLNATSAISLLQALRIPEDIQCLDLCIKLGMYERGRLNNIMNACGKYPSSRPDLDQAERQRSI